MKKRIKNMSPSWFDFVVLLIGFTGTALALDLTLVAFGNVCLSFLIYEIAFCLYWLINVVIYIIIKRKRGNKK